MEIRGEILAMCDHKGDISVLSKRAAEYLKSGKVRQVTFPGAVDNQAALAAIEERKAGQMVKESPGVSQAIDDFLDAYDVTGDDWERAQKVMKEFKLFLLDWEA